MRRYVAIAVIATFSLGACEENSTPLTATERPATDSPPTQQSAPSSPRVDDLLPQDMLEFWEPWQGDLDGMVERRVVRALTTFGGYQFYYDDGRPRGATWDMLSAFEAYLNTELGRGNIRVYVLPVPVSRDQLIPSLISGRGDLIASDLTLTEARRAQLEFTRPLLTGINEVVVTNASAAAIQSIHDLSGREIVVRPSSSYHEHLEDLAALFESRRLPPPVLRAADELLEAEDLLEMLSHDEIGITIVDDYKARFWAQVFPNIAIHDDLIVAGNSSIAWAHRKHSPLLAGTLEGFLKSHGRGTLFGNDTYARHLADASRVRCANGGPPTERIDTLIRLFTQYGERYDIDWLRLGAQAFQESGLKQERRSSAGAVGIMQIKPSTAADKNVAIAGIDKLENNIHAGAKYMRFLADRYFSDGEFDELNRWLFSLAAYNAGPARVIKLRREAAQQGYDATRWFDNVEVIAARRIGRETVSYVSNIYKYYVGYQLTTERSKIHNTRFRERLSACFEPR